MIGDATEYESMKDQLQEALGGNAILVKEWSNLSDSTNRSG